MSLPGIIQRGKCLVFEKMSSSIFIMAALYTRYRKGILTSTDMWTWALVAQTVKRLSTMRETRVWSLGQEDPLEKEMATHSSTLAWKIPWTQSTGSQRVGHDWATSLHFTGKTPVCAAFKIFVFFPHAWSYIRYQSAGKIKIKQKWMIPQSLGLLEYVK